MSRVDEAWRRASGRDGEDRPYQTVGERRSVDEFVLEDYPREHGPDRIAVVPAAARPVSAPRATGPVGSLGPSLDNKLVGHAETPAVVVEQYRRLADVLHERQVDTGLKTMMVTSAMPREGKTLTVTNLALTLTASYRRRVLLIDADLRRPSIHDVFRLPRTIGLSEALRSGSRPHLLELSPLLSVLPAGQLEGDPLVALTSDRLPALVEQCASAFDWVLMDTPPVGLMADGNVLARVTKAVVFVVAAGGAPYKTVERAMSELGRECIIGTVLNRIDEQQLPKAHHYREYYGAATPPRE